MQLGEQIKKSLPTIWTKIKTFLITRDVFIFIVFLFVSSILWLSLALNKTYETLISVPINYVNIPNKYEFSEDLPESIDIKVQDKGTVLFSYGRSHFKPLTIDLDNYKTDAKQIIIHTSNLFEKSVKNQLSQTTLILEYYPEVINIEQNKLVSKVVPVKLITDIKLDQQYYLTDTCTINPKFVTIYGNQKFIDSTNYINTQTLFIVNNRDTVRQSIELNLPKYCKANPNAVDAMVPIDFYTEAKANIPIIAKNTPKNINVRIIPSRVDISYMVGIGSFNSIDTKDFVISIDYKDLIRSNSKTKILNIDKAPSSVLNIKLEPNEVEWIMEVVQ